MTSAVTRTVPASPSIETARAPAWRDQVARGVLAVAAVGALVSALGALATATAADDAMAVVAWHDLLGYPVFAALFALLAWRPRGYPGIWELLIVQKAVIAIVAASLAMALAVTYVLARAHTAWTRSLNGVDR